MSKNRSLQSSALELIIIAAMTRRGVIGRAQGLPWNIPEEYDHFVGLVRGETVIMGRTSYEIFGKDLGESKLIVTSRSVADLPGVTVAASVNRAIEVAATFGGRVFSAGGASIYEQTIPLAGWMYLSYLKGDCEGDVYFPNYRLGDWTKEREREHARFTFYVYRRKRIGGGSRLAPRAD